MSRKLIEEGTRAWNSISQNKHHVHWENVVFEIEEQFMRISGCSSRSLTQQVFLSSWFSRKNLLFVILSTSKLSMLFSELVSALLLHLIRLGL